MRIASFLAVPFLAIVASAFLVACGDSPPADEPEHITVDHILIGVKSARTLIPRTEDQGRKLAEDIIERLNAGADWDKLKSAYSEDPPEKRRPRGGPYNMANTGVSPSAANEFRRKDMVPAFGNVGFKLGVGEIGLAQFHPKTSPFGFHIIKRIR
jgi:hypothetical protein